MLPIILVATFMAQFDLYVVNVALPVLRRGLGMDDVLVELVVSGYAFAYASGLIMGGRLGDHFGHRRMYMIGMSGFGLASLACGMSPTGVILVSFRLAQGATAALMVPQVLAMIGANFLPAQRSRALSWFGAAIGTGSIAGQIIGGVLLQADVAGLGWRPIFLVNVPIALVVVMMASTHLPRDLDSSAEQDKSRSLDYGGAVGIFATLVLVLFPLSFARSESWSGRSWAMITCAGLICGVTIKYEARLERIGGAPILPPSLFRRSAFNVGLLLASMQCAAFFSLIFCLTLVLQDGLGLSPMQAGWAFAPMGCAFAGASIGFRAVLQRRGGVVIVAGSLVALSGMAVIVGVSVVRGSHLAALEIIIPLAVVGFGNGIAIPAVIGQVLQRVDSMHAGAVAGILTTAQQFASALGIAAIGGVFLMRVAGGGQANHASALAVAAGIDTALMGAATGLAVRLAHLRPAGAEAKPV